MCYNKNRLSIALLICLIVVPACNKESVFSYEEQQTLVSDNNLPLKKLAQSKNSLTAEDAATVILLSRQIPGTRSSSALIRNVVPISGDDGEPLLYAVNLDKGFTLVSAFKTSPPILAEVPNGIYAPSEEDASLDFIVKQIALNVKKHKSDTLSNEMKSLWFQYEESTVPDMINTRSYSTIWDAIGAYVQMWTQNGLDYYYLYNQPPGLSNSEYAQLCYDASCYERDGYNYMDYSFITREVVNTTLQKGPYLSTTWGRSYPYYPSSPGSYKVETVSVGQLMRYYENPNTYSWYLMPNHQINTDSPNAQLTWLLSSVESALVSLQSLGQTKPNSIKNYLNSYYYCSINSHNISNVISSLNNHNPLIMTGEDSSGTTFSWCCDGYQKQDYHTEFYVWYLADSAYPDFDYERGDGVYNSQTTIYYCHLNWGNNGSNDGWFELSHIDYSNNMKNIIITGNK